MDAIQVTGEYPARGGNEAEHTIRPPSRQSVQRGFRHWLRLDGDRSHGVDLHPLFRYQHLWARILACHPECRNDPSQRLIGRGGHRASVRRVGCCVRFRVGSCSLVSPVSEILTPWIVAVSSGLPFMEQCMPSRCLSYHLRYCGYLWDLP